MGYSKILNDTLKNSSGKYSRKSLTMLVSFIIAILIAFVICFGEWKGKKFEKSYEIFECFMLMAGYNGLLSVSDKKIQKSEK